MSRARPNASGPLAHLLLVAFLLSPAAVPAAELLVPQQFPTIQAAVDAALAGDAVVVAPGRYVEQVQLTGKDLTLRSAAGATSTIIDAGGAGTALAVTSVTNATVVEGFTLTNAGESGLVLASAPIRLRKSVISGNAAANGGGVRASGSNALLEDCVVENNAAMGAGGGIYAVYGGPNLLRTVVRGNRAGNGGGLYAYYYSVLYLYDSLVEANEATYDGGGLYGEYYGWFQVYRTRISLNYAGNAGGGAFSAPGGDITVRHSQVDRNEAQLGGGLAASGGELRIDNATVAGNRAPVGGGVYAPGAATWILLWNSIVHGNSSPPVLEPSSIQLATSDVEGGYGGSMDADPLFVDAAAGDFHLAAGSPCIDAGSPLWYGGGGSAGGGAGWTYDVDRLPRPLGAAVDIGADEYGVAYDRDGDGWFEGFGDCNDASASVYPDAPEIPYDGVDQNCNGLADDDDVDRDGYPAATDCDDHDAQTHPGAPEINYDGKDQDCDGKDGTVGVPIVSIQHVPVSVGITQCNDASIAGNIVAYGREEDGQDLNGDGDTYDALISYYDLPTRTLVTTAIEARGEVSTDGNIIATVGSNGNLAYYRISTAKLEDTGISGASLGAFKSVSGGKIAYEVSRDGASDVCVYDTKGRAERCLGAPGSRPSISGNLVAFTRGFPGTVAYWDLSTGAVVDTRYEGTRVVIDGTQIVFAKSNGGSWWGGALVVYDVSTRTAIETGIDDWYRFSISNGIVSIITNSEGYGWPDLNGDGDRDDYYVLVFYDVRNQRVVNTGILACCGGDIWNGVVVFDTYEGTADVNADINGDGDADDCAQQWARLDTIAVTRAEYDAAGQKLTVVANSASGAAASLVLSGYGPMAYRAKTRDWEYKAALPAAPASVTVTGPEGSLTVPVTVR